MRIFYTGQFMCERGGGGALASVFPVCGLCMSVKMSCHTERDDMGTLRIGIETPKRSLRHAFANHKKAKEEEEIEG